MLELDETLLEKIRKETEYLEDRVEIMEIFKESLSADEIGRLDKLHAAALDLSQVVWEMLYRCFERQAGKANPISPRQNPASEP